MASQLLGIKTRFTNDLGSPLVGGQVYTYFAGTSTNQDSYSDAALTVPNTNPVILDDTGSADIFLKGSYRIRVFNASGQFIEEQDNIVQVAAQNDATELKNKVAAVEQDVIDTNAELNAQKLDTGITAIAQNTDMVERSQATINAERISLLSFIPIALHASILNYSYIDDVKTYVQKAVDYCVLNNKKLTVPAGGYLIDSAFVPVNLVNYWSADKNLIIEGAGEGLTIFKSADGAVNRGGRYTKMFYLYYGDSSFVGSFGHIKISGITFDMNGSSNINDTGSLYNYEQSHIISGAGSGTVDIKSINLSDVEFKDKVGAGFNLSSSSTARIRKVTCNNVFSRKHPKVSVVGGDGTFGQRGCLEFGTNIDVLDINNPDVLYAQIEPVIESTVNLQRNASVVGGNIDNFEWTDKGDYSFATVVNLTSKDSFLCRGIQASITNSTLKIRATFAGGIVKISGGTILLDYNSTTNVVTPLLHATASGYTDYAELWLSDVDVKIDSSDPAILPTGVAVDGGTTGLAGSRKRFLNNVKFDSRLEVSVGAYGNGDWKVVNCDLQGRLYHVRVGGSATLRGGNVELHNNTFSGTGSKVQLERNNLLWTLKVSGTYPLLNFFSTTGAQEYKDLILQKPTLTSTNSPSTERAPVGQMVLNNTPTVGGYTHWIKIGAADTSSSWSKFGLIS